MEIATVESDELLCKAEYRYGDARVGVGEVFDAFYGGHVNRALIGYQGLSNSSDAYSATPYSGTNSGGVRLGK